MTNRDSERNLRRVNLNLLPILRELLRQRNVTEAAKRLNLTQSGVSEALGRLRAQFGDDLLVRVGRKMTPTALALELAPQLVARARYGSQELWHGGAAGRRCGRGRALGG